MYNFFFFFLPKVFGIGQCGYNLGLRILLFKIFALNFDFSHGNPVAKPNFIENSYFLMSRAFTFVIKHNYNIFKDKIVSGLNVIGLVYILSRLFALLVF